VAQPTSLDEISSEGSRRDFLKMKQRSGVSNEFEQVFQTWEKLYIELVINTKKTKERREKARPLLTPK
jgi:hypothetical protein